MGDLIMDETLMDNSNEQGNTSIIEQNRLQALIEISEQHNKEVKQLTLKAETTEKKSIKLNTQLKQAETEIKNLRVHNPDRMKKQIKRLQEQNRALTAENGSLKNKQKQLTKQLKEKTQEFDECKEKLDKLDNTEQTEQKETETE